MGKRSKEEIEENEGGNEVEEIKDKKTRPSRTVSKKKVDYSEYEDDFESDFSEDYCEDGEDDSSDVDMDDYESANVNSGKGSKKSTKKSEKNDKNSKKCGNPRKNRECGDEGDFKIDSDDEEDVDNETEEDMDDLDDECEEPKGGKNSSKKNEKSSKKKPTAPKNLTKRNVVVNNCGGSSLSEVIYNYMKDQNRPYSIQNVVDNLHNVYSKKQVTDEMDRQTSEGRFICKEYGKQKVYLFEQSQYKEFNKDEIEELDKQISKYESELNDLEIKLKQLKQETRNITVPLPIEVLEEKIIEETKKVSY
ncbi:hypothetical protein FG386_001810 [Cryptosporidium ryanae]|uniref:uncharacterized protein n=1 Tax=Cryptosporidium ryanae TaxID=515981 RepID=UPI00351A2267|nr:hypothetical protein FG386_001810 [Cryptosporidium ryanae]